MTPEMSVGSKVRVVDDASPFYRLRGEITAENETDGKFRCELESSDGRVSADFSSGQLACVQKRFVDIEHLREADVVLGKDEYGEDIVRRSNAGAFEPGDVVQITEKIDGSNASVSYNAEDRVLETFSRTSVLDSENGLRGFRDWVLAKFGDQWLSDSPDIVVFGEWCVGHTVKYEKSWYGTWRVYDIWSKSKKSYLPQAEVKSFCEKHGVEYIKELYLGPFAGWEHARSFLHANSYGGDQEGVVIKNQTKLGRGDVRLPKYLKIVNEKFRESSSKREKKEIDPETKRAMEESKATMASVVTEARVNKAILKLVDEGLVPAELTPKCMGAVMKHLPRAIWLDVVKEEPETAKAAGPYAGKFCSALAAEFARKIILGSN